MPRSWNHRQHRHLPSEGDVTQQCIGKVGPLLQNTTANTSPFVDLYSISAPPIESTTNLPPTSNARALQSHCSTQNVSCGGTGTASRRFSAICNGLVLPSASDSALTVLLSWCSRQSNCIPSHAAFREHTSYFRVRLSLRIYASPRVSILSISAILFCFHTCTGWSRLPIWYRYSPGHSFSCVASCTSFSHFGIRVSLCTYVLFFFLRACKIHVR